MEGFQMAMRSVKASGLETADRRYLSSVMSRDLLGEQEELDLARAWRERGDQRAMQKMVSAYLRLVVATAGKFRHYGLAMSDLIQEGNIGLMLAINRFDPERGVRFSTYASWWIRSSMQEFVLRNWSIVRSGTSAGQKALFFNLRWLRAKLEQAGGSGHLDNATRDSIAVALKVSPGEVSAMAQRLGGRDHSLNEPMGGEEGGEAFQDFLVDPNPNPEEIELSRHDSALRREWLQAALGQLNPREKLIVSERMLNDEKVTLEELGERLGVTKERVRQIETKAFAKLQNMVLRKSAEAGEVFLEGLSPATLKSPAGNLACC